MQRKIYLGSAATIAEVLGNLGGLLGLWNELGWLELQAQRARVRRTTSGKLNGRERLSEKKKKKMFHQQFCFGI
ncbi:jg21165 [Pararge aegeria aegeria]|uniref:Jg21165 protein n=1 Tax=Pararge aegeria aegeria TaxID=348720 RepID=A0A8S4SP90_9NEOP|nr:jg21165 [Pararge aegeria aegeria]